MSIKNVVVLLSGGIDSTACLDFYLEQSFNATCLFIDYGQPSRLNEYKAVKRICSYYKTSYQKISVKGNSPISKGYSRGRNLFLISIGFLNTKIKSGFIATGIHSATNYPDCSEGFISSCQDAIDIYEGGKIILGTPFLKWTKNDVWQYCLEKEVPIHLTYSCENGLRQPCGKCLSCKDLKRLYVS